MFRKIHSKRDPEKTIWEEINNEFHPYFSKANQGMAFVLKKYPKQIYVAMLILICISAVLAATVLRPEPVNLSMYPNISKPTIDKQQSSPSNGFLDNLDLLQQTLKLEGEVKEILDKPTLSLEDSLVLENKIKELEAINSQVIK